MFLALLKRETSHEEEDLKRKKKHIHNWKEKDIPSFYLQIQYTLDSHMLHRYIFFLLKIKRGKDKSPNPTYSF